MTRPPLPVMVAIALPLLLAVAVAAIAITVRASGVGEPPGADTTPLAVAPVDAPAAAGPACAGLLAALPAELPATDAPLALRPLADPGQPGVRAWVATPRPAVLRCGLPRPAELTPTSALLEINGVRWLRLDDGVDARSDATRDPVVVSYVAVDRPVYVALTVPTDTGSGPLQQVSDSIRDALPSTEVAVR